MPLKSSRGILVVPRGETDKQKYRHDEGNSRLSQIITTFIFSIWLLGYLEEKSYFNFVKDIEI